MGTYSNILAADSTSNTLDAEICGDHVRYLDYRNGPIVHTNHFLSPYGEGTNEATDERFASSRARYARGSQLYGSVAAALARFKLMLADEEDAPNEICRTYRMVEGNILGTVSSIIMDLQNQALHITAGKCSENPWQCLTIN